MKVCALISLFLAALPLRAVIVDRMAIAVGDQVITESQIEDEVRLTAFLNGDKLDLSEAEKRKAADRLIEQTLIKREMEFSHYPLPPLSDAEASLKALKSGYPTEQLYEQALRKYGITENDLKNRLWWQLTVLRFIDYRFRPGILVSNAEIQEYYQQQVAKWQKDGVSPVPTLEDSRPRIEEILTQERIDKSLDDWLVQARTQVPMRYLDEALK